MCMVKDAAMIMVNRSIDLAEEKERREFYLTPVKLHKLLYLAQGYMLSTHNKRLFREDIEAHQCGPYVLGIQFVSAEMGLDLYKQRFQSHEYVLLSPMRMDAIDKVLIHFGDLETDRLVHITKNTQPYLNVYDRIDVEKPIISVESMRLMGDTFKEHNVE